MSNKTSVAALILTKNEENILGKCLDALHFVERIFVFDSFSTDNTLKIASRYNAVVHQRKFDNYASQRNAALEIVPKNHRWILMVDADEIVTAELRDEILNVTKNENGIAMYRVRRKDMFQQKWIRFSSGYPTWFPRLFRNGQVKVSRAINEEYEASGSEAYLKEHLEHYPFNKGIGWWVEKHNRYSEMEASLMMSEIKEPVKWSNLFAKNPVVRRRAQKRLSYRLPFRPQLVFFAFYIVKGGFLDGKRGYDICRMRQMYEQMISLKFKELRTWKTSDSIE